MNDNDLVQVIICRTGYSDGNATLAVRRTLLTLVKMACFDAWRPGLLTQPIRDRSKHLGDKSYAPSKLSTTRCQKWYSLTEKGYACNPQKNMCINHYPYKVASNALYDLERE